MLGSSLTPKTVYLVPHSRLDLEWKVSFKESGRISSQCLIGAVHMIENHSEFRFVAEPVVIVKYFLENYPQYKEKFIQFVKEGRIEVPGMWVSPDENLPSDESLVRTIIEGYEWCRENDIAPNGVAWQVDVFGHPATLPHLVNNHPSKTGSL